MRIAANRDVGTRANRSTRNSDRIGHYDMAWIGAIRRNGEFDD